MASHDAYLAVVLLSGDYALEQDGNEAVLRPGDMAIYDATRPHRIHCPRDFSKLILSIPRPLLRERMAGIERCAALRISGAAGVGAVASNFMRACSQNAGAFAAHESAALADQALDLVTLAAASVRPAAFALSKSRAATLARVKALIEQRLSDFALDTAMIARSAGLSPRYLNSLFGEEGTSLMRYVWRRRLEHCARHLTDPRRAGERIAEIAFRWGFSDASHFSRAFRQQFGCAPGDFRRGPGDVVQLHDAPTAGMIPAGQRTPAPTRSGIAVGGATWSTIPHGVSASSSPRTQPVPTPVCSADRSSCGTPAAAGEDTSFGRR